MHQTSQREEAGHRTETHYIAWSGDAVLLLPLCSSPPRGRLANMTGARARAYATGLLFALVRSLAFCAGRHDPDRRLAAENAP